MKLTKDDLDYAIHRDLYPAPDVTPYKPSEHVDPSWSGQGDTDDPPREPDDGWRMAALAIGSAGVGAAVLLLARWALS